MNYGERESERMEESFKWNEMTISAGDWLRENFKLKWRIDRRIY